jgi:TP901 family phage tail tape measure protein
MSTNTEKIVIQVQVTGAKELQNLEKSTSKATKSVSSFTKSMIKAGAVVGSALILYRQLNRTVGQALKTFKDFEFQMAKVKAMTGATDEEFEKLNTTAQNLGRTTFFTASEVAALQVNLSKLGFTTSEVLNTQEAILLLSTAASEDLARSATVVGAAIRGFNEDASEAARFADVMAVAFTNSALDLEKFQTSMTKVSSIAAMLGFTFEETTAMIGALTDAGIEASIAGTALRQILLFLGDPASNLSKKIGMTVKSGEDFIVALEKMNKEGVRLDDILKVVNRRQVVAFNRFLNSTESLRGLITQMDNATGAAKEMSSVMEESVEGSFKKVKSAWDGFIIAILEGNGTISRTLQKIMVNVADFLNNISDKQKEVSDFALEIALDIMKDVREEAQKTGDLVSDILSPKIRKMQKELDKARIALVSEGGEPEARKRLDELTGILKFRQKLGLELAEADIEEVNRIREKLMVVDLHAGALKIMQDELKTTLELEERKRKEGEKEIIVQESLIAIQEKLLFNAKELPERTEKEIASKNKLIKSIQEEIKRLKELGIEIKDTKKKRDDLIETDISYFENLGAMQVFSHANTLDELKQLDQEWKDFRIQTAQETANAIFEIERNNAQRRQAQQLSLLESRLESGVISQERYEKEVDAINRQAFNQERNANIAKATMNMLMGITKVLGDPLAAPKIALITTTGLAQIAAIASQKYAIGGMIEEFANGGMVYGNSHAQGGEKFAVGGRVVELEGGEAVINKRSTSMYRPLLSQINSIGGGVKFADGGLLNQSSFSQSQFNAIGQAGMMGAISEGNKVVVVESDITNSQNAVNVIQSQAGF